MFPSNARESRLMVVAGQNETLRKSSDADVYLATIGLNGCVALIISDEKGTVSLTHIDRNTDLSFIADELKIMSGNVQIYLVKRKGTGDLSLVIRNVILNLNLDKSTHTLHPIKESEEGTILVHSKKRVPQSFSMRDFIEITNPHIPQSPDNKLNELGYRVELCTPDPLEYQRRIYVRQLNAVLADRARPLLVYNNGWIETRQELAPQTRVFVETGRVGSATPGLFDQYEIGSLNYVRPRYLALMQAKSKANSTDNITPAP